MVQARKTETRHSLVLCQPLSRTQELLATLDHHMPHTARNYPCALLTDTRLT
jgi:Cft2 family RNA processing exonuclease